MNVILSILMAILGLNSYVDIPSIDLHENIQLVKIVDRQYDVSQLGNGVGRLQYTTWGRVDGGRTVLIGHNPGAFSELNQLQKGDIIYLYEYELGYILEFEVYSVYTTYPADTSILKVPSKEFELALITCTDDGQGRLIVRAKLR